MPWCPCEVSCWWWVILGTPLCGWRRPGVRTNATSGVGPTARRQSDQHSCSWWGSEPKSTGTVCGLQQYDPDQRLEQLLGHWIWMGSTLTLRPGRSWREYYASLQTPLHCPTMNLKPPWAHSHHQHRKSPTHHDEQGNCQTIKEPMGKPHFPCGQEKLRVAPWHPGVLMRSVNLPRTFSCSKASLAIYCQMDSRGQLTSRQPKQEQAEHWVKSLCMIKLTCLTIISFPLYCLPHYVRVHVLY